MINVQKNLACLNPLLRNRVIGIKRVQYWTPVSLEGKQVTIFLLARIKNDRPFEFYRFLVYTANAWWNEWKVVTFASQAAVPLIVLRGYWQMGRRLENSSRRRRATSSHI